MLLSEELDVLSEVLKILGDKMRLRILALLRARELCVCELTEVLQISQPGVSQHLRRLRQGGLVKERREGQWTYYSLNQEHPVLIHVISLIPDIPEDKKRLSEVSGCKVSDQARQER